MTHKGTKESLCGQGCHHQGPCSLGLFWNFGRLGAERPLLNFTYPWYIFLFQLVVFI